MAIEPDPPRKASPSRIPAWIWPVLIVIALIALGVELVVIRKSPAPPAQSLPVLAETPEFTFTSQSGAPVARADMAGKIWIADFIFTRCAGPCPLMTEKMRQIQEASERLDGGDVRLVSVSVDPEHDTPEVLTDYAARVGADPDRWTFLTGDPAKIEEFTTKGMLLGLARDGEGMPVHTQKFVVVDRQGRIRAYHDLEKPTLIPDILADVETLTRETPAPRSTP